MLSLKDPISVLVVDDEEDVRETLCSFLELFPGIAKVIQAENGSDGIRKIQNQKFNIIVSDLVMPKMNGIDFIKNVKAYEKSTRPKEDPTPILILSANVTSKEVKEALGMGVRYVMTKPCTADQFVTKIQEVFKKEYNLDLDVDL
jgi:two-component system chemotaxis response regulator CheY